MICSSTALLPLAEYLSAIPRSHVVDIGPSSVQPSTMKPSSTATSLRVGRICYSGLPSHDCILLSKPRNLRYRLRPSGSRSSNTLQSLLRGILELAGLPHVIARVTGRTCPGAPLKNWWKERPSPACVDTPGPKLCPNIASKQHTTHQCRIYSVGRIL